MNPIQALIDTAEMMLVGVGEDVHTERLDALRAAIPAARAEMEKGGWIPAEERLPDAVALDNVAHELRLARTKFRNMSSGHEAYAVILEEVEEFWIEVQANKGDLNLRKIKMAKELIQVAAMAVRAVTDIATPEFSAEYQIHPLPAPHKENTDADQS